MGTKRHHSELDTGVAMQDGPEQQRHDSPASENGDQPATKRSKTNSASKKKHKSKEGTTNWNKSRARAIRRLLQSGKELPATVRNDLEQELEALQDRVEEHSFKKRRSHMIQKYHMVRFFERKKAERLLKQLRKKIQQTEDPEEKQRLEAEAHVAEVDVAYARFYPLMEPYQSLYPNKDTQEGDSKDEDKPEEEKFKQPKALRALHAERPKMWATVEKTLPQGEAALYRLRDRKSPTDDTAAAPKRQPVKKAAWGPAAAKARFPAQQQHQKQKDRVQDRRSEGKGRKWQAPVEVQDDDEDDGTGFFE